MIRLPSSAVIRLAGLASLAYALVTCLLGLGVFWATRTELAYDLDQRIATERVALLREAATTGLSEVVSARAAHGSQDMRYALVDRRGRVVAGEPVTSTPAPGWSDLEFIQDGEPDPTRALVSRQPDGTLLVVGADPEAIEQLSARLVQLFALAFGLIAVIGVAGSLFLGRHLARRLGAVNRIAEAIIGGDLHQRMPVGAAGDEFDRLATTLNRMLDRIEELLGNLRQVSGDIAHDLRTPLSRLRQTLEAGLVGDHDPSALRAAIAVAIDRSDDALALFAAILAISEVEARSGLDMERIDLSTLVQDVAAGYRPSVEDEGRPFEVSVEPALHIVGNGQLLAQMLGNLIANAMRHTPQSSPIAIRLAADGERARLIVADAGPGIPESERRTVFNRFARMDRSRSTPGHGLGLSMAAAVAHAHRGSVSIEDAEPGVKAIVALPLQRR